ncbi:DegT/DnrJ/EryC1/StrS family aminotransferase [Cerasicoccus fimbriatus]|uniref:DegT/DnrJ/EryC1/StrS family aminotransferase n=1 Tax=Cerasicoccus fimbriatus TaxID=3014554 RepID=UPI0022B4D41C|nr:DegT/DnrJ/EryC1/StrS family aminotransferase [Cerasicoccus sp. TK19100]
MKPQLAINGGDPVRSAPWPKWPQYGAEEEAATLRVVRSSNAHPMFGPETERFEKVFAAYHGGGFAVAVGSGTAALQLSLAAAGVGCGHEVICPSYTYVASASAAVEQNAVPVFVDSEPLSQGADPREIAKKITPATKAIVLVHVNGYPCDIDPVIELAREHGIAVIEDCSHAHGATHRGRKVGTIGDFGAFSIQQKKNLSAGTGGVVFTHCEKTAEHMRDLRTFHWNKVGHNWLINEFSSAIAACQLKKLDVMNAARRRHAQIIVDGLRGIEGITPLPGLPDTEPSFYNLILQYDESVIGLPRSEFIKALAAEGIPINMFYQPLQRWPIFAEADFYGRGSPFSDPMQANGAPDYGSVSTPLAEAICDRINLEIKVQPTCFEQDMHDVVTAISKVLQHRAELSTPVCS